MFIPPLAFDLFCYDSNKWIHIHYLKLLWVKIKINLLEMPYEPIEEFEKYYFRSI